MIETAYSNALRVGNFTSSEIYKLMSMGRRPMTEDELKARPKKGPGAKSEFVKDGPGEAFYNYIDKKKRERKLGRPVNEDVSTRPLEWGKFLEARAFRLLGFNYTRTSNITIQHPIIPELVGTPDGETDDAGVEVKCPFTLDSFCDLVECKDITEIRAKHKDGEKFYWQTVNNSMLKNKPYGELVIYLPYQSELREIREETEYYEGDLNKVAWIRFAQDDDLPYLVDGREYKNLNVFRFLIPEQDKKRLTHRVELAARLLKA